MASSASQSSTLGSIAGPFLHELGFVFGRSHQAVELLRMQHIAMQKDSGMQEICARVDRQLEEFTAKPVEFIAEQRERVLGESFPSRHHTDLKDVSLLPRDIQAHLLLHGIPNADTGVMCKQLQLVGQLVDIRRMHERGSGEVHPLTKHAMRDFLINFEFSKK